MYVLLELDALDCRGQLQPGHAIELSVRVLHWTGLTSGNPST